MEGGPCPLGPTLATAVYSAHCMVPALSTTFNKERSIHGDAIPTINTERGRQNTTK